MTIAETTRVNPSLFTRDALYLDGQWRTNDERPVLEVVDPYTEQVIGSVPQAIVSDVDIAVAGAVRAFSESPWRSMNYAERGEVLGRVAEELRSRAADLIELYVHDQGGVRSFGAGTAARGAAIFDEHVVLSRTLSSEPEVRESSGSRVLVLREPVGPVLAIVPWNAPLVLAAVKIAPALLAGCPIVVKVSPESPLVSFVLAEALDAAGVPAGMVSFLPGGRASMGDIAARPEFRHISFTGSTTSGTAIMKTAAENITRVTLELGGKSAAIVLDDLDPAEGAGKMFPGSLSQSGQVCTTFSRILVPASRAEEWTRALVDMFSAIRPGDPDDPDTVFGPLITSAHRASVERYIDIARAEGAEILTGGGRPDGLSHGFFVEPTLVGNVTNDMTVVREEVFGPVITLQTYADIDEAVALANDSEYGLAGGIFTNDVDRAVEVARRIEAGAIAINSFGAIVTEPFGGYKKSGIGREGGLEGVEDLLEVKQIQLSRGA